jgi:ADP-ribose pyrophosphatase
MPKHLPQKFTEELHQNPWWTYKHDIYEKPNGEDGDYYYGETPGYTMTVPMLPDGRLLLTIQYRYLNQKQSIEFPGGGIKPGVEVETSTRLELKEETGYIADSLIKLGTFEPSSGLLKDQTHVFLAYVSEAGDQELDDTEEIELITRRPDEFQRMVQNGEIWCGQTLGAWALVQSYLSKQAEDSQFLEAPNVKRLTDKIFGIFDL